VFQKEVEEERRGEGSRGVIGPARSILLTLKRRRKDEKGRETK
jgi:hypothetical protein